MIQSYKYQCYAFPAANSAWLRQNTYYYDVLSITALHKSNHQWCWSNLRDSRKKSNVFTASINHFSLLCVLYARNKTKKNQRICDGKKCSICTLLAPNPPLEQFSYFHNFLRLLFIIQLLHNFFIWRKRRFAIVSFDFFETLNFEYSIYKGSNLLTIYKKMFFEPKLWLYLKNVFDIRIEDCVNIA